MDVFKTAEAVDAYMQDALLRADPVLDEIARASEAAGLVPHAVTPLQAAFLAMLVRLTGAGQILEIGCLGGYSAVAMARAMPEGGHLLTTEIDTRTAEVAAQNIAASGYGDRIELRVGPAMPELEKELAEGRIFDLVFIDADKVNHRNYLEMALKMTRPGGLIIADNVVRGGAVLDAESKANAVRGVREMFAFAQTLDNVRMTGLQSIGEKGHDGMALFFVEAR